MGAWSGGTPNWRTNRWKNNSITATMDNAMRARYNSPDLLSIMSKEFDMERKEIEYYFNRFIKEYGKDDLNPLRDLLIKMKMHWSADWQELKREEEEKARKKEEYFQWLKQQESKFRNYLDEWKEGKFIWLKNLEGTKVKKLDPELQKEIYFFEKENDVELSFWSKRIQLKHDNPNSLSVPDEVMNQREESFNLPPRGFMHHGLRNGPWV